MSALYDTFHFYIGQQGEDFLWWQMSIRALVILAFGLVIVRVAGKRIFGKWGAIDILVSVIIGSNLSRALTGSAPFWPTLAATTVLVAAHGLLITLAVKFDWLGPLLKGRPVRIVHDGEPDHKVMSKLGIGTRDLEEALRMAGVTGCEHVDEAWVERNGDISVIHAGKVDRAPRG